MSDTVVGITLNLIYSNLFFKQIFYILECVDKINKILNTLYNWSW